MKGLLRSIIAVATEDAGELFQNFLKLETSGLGFDTPEDVKLHAYIKDFVRAHNHVPDISVVRSYFTHKQEPEVTDRLEVVSVLPAVFKGNFEHRLTTLATKRKVLVVQGMLRDAATIVQSGLEIRDGKETTRLFGPTDAVRYFNDKAHLILTPTLGGRLYGEATKDGDDFWEEYLTLESDPLSGIGQMCGLKQADEALRGAKRAELWTHAAFTGGLKSTFILNWAYNQAVYYGHSGLIFSLEMPYTQNRRILFSLHSMHGKFTPIRIQLGLQVDPSVSTCVPYENIRDGTLSDNQRIFLRDYVIPDFKDPANSYGEIHIEVPDPDKADFTVADARTRAEVLYSKKPFRTIWIDHMGLMSPRKWVSSTTERLNEIVRDLKRMAMGFNRGAGIAVVNLSQLSREGYKSAVKKEEAEQAKGLPATGHYYNLTALSYSNEIERSSDIVTTSYINDEMRVQGRVWFQNLKSRDQKPFEPFQARVDWPCRRLQSITVVPQGPSPQGLGEEIDLDED